VAAANGLKPSRKLQVKFVGDRAAFARAISRAVGDPVLAEEGMQRWERLSPREQRRFEDWVPARYALWMRSREQRHLLPMVVRRISATPRPRARTRSRSPQRARAPDDPHPEPDVAPGARQ
jgi:hypothetical protein